MGAIRLNDTQDLPVPNDSKPIADLVCEDIQARKEMGLKKYGTPLQAFNGRNALKDLYEELLDATKYCKQLLVEMEKHAVREVQGRGDNS